MKEDFIVGVSWEETDDDKGEGLKGELREKRNVGRDGFITVVASERQIRTVIDQSE